MLFISSNSTWLHARLLLLVLILCLLNQRGYSQTRAQTAVYYDHIKPLLVLNTSDTTLVMRIDSLRKMARFSRSTVTSLFNRDIDFNVSHRRIIIYTGMINFQVDVASENGRVVALAVGTSDVFADSIRRQDVLLQTCDTAAITQYLASRNGFYQSHKTIRNFFTEIQASEQFAFYCGDASPKTEKGAYIEHLAGTNQINVLADMLANIHCETQAYAVAGFAMLKNNPRITPQQKLLVKYIKQRNSVVVTCEGCLSGLRRRLYSTNH
jgi:hypothetical protein